MRFIRKPIFWIIAVALIITIPLGILLITGALTPSAETHEPPLLSDPRILIDEQPAGITAVSIVYENRQMSDITLQAGNKISLGANIDPEGFSGYVAWDSSDTSIFKVDPINARGTAVNVTAISEGIATLTASADGSRVECTVRVKRFDSGFTSWKDEPQEQLGRYLTGLFNEAYEPYYGGLSFDMSYYEEEVADGDYTATFFWTMHHRNNGLDIASDYGKEQEANWSLMATARIDNGQLRESSIKVLADDSMTGPPTYQAPIEDYFPPAPATLPVERELVRDYVQRYIQLIEDGDANELARFLLIDGGVTDRYVEIAKRIIEHHAQYDTSWAMIMFIHYHEFDNERQYIILVRDGRDEMFKVYASYGDSLLGIDVRMYE